MGSTDLNRELLLLQADFLEELGQEDAAAQLRVSADADTPDPVPAAASSVPGVSEDSSADEVADLALLKLEAQKRRIENEMKALRADEQGIRLRLKEQLVGAHRDVAQSDDPVLAAVHDLMEEEQAALTRRERRRQ